MSNGSRPGAHEIASKHKHHMAARHRQHEEAVEAAWREFLKDVGDIDDRTRTLLRQAFDAGVSAGR